MGIGPVDDLGLVELEAVMMRSGQARRLADGTVNVCDGPARPANTVVMIVADPRLIAYEGTGGLDPPQHTHVA